MFEDPRQNKLKEQLDKLHGRVSEQPQQVNNVVKMKLLDVDYELQQLEKEAPFANLFPIEWKKAMIGLKLLHNAPYDMSAVCLLGYTNIATHHLYNVNSHLYGIRPSSLFLTLLLQSGGLKSTIGSELIQPFNEFIDLWYDVLRDEQYRYASDMKVYKKELQRYEKEKEEGGVPEFPQSPKKAETSGYKIKKATTAGIFAKLDTQPFVNVVTSEGAGFFKSHAFQDETRSNEMTDALIDLWDGSTLSYDLKEKSYHLANRRMSMILMSQYAPIAPTLNNVIMQEQGFIHRILLANIQPFEKKAMNEHDPELDDKEQQEYRKLIEPFLNRLRELFQQRRQERENKDFELDPITMHISLDARKKGAQYYNMSLEWGAENNRLGRYEGFASRLHEHMIRIACTLAAFNNHAEITEDDMIASIEFMELFINHRVSITRGIINENPNLSQGSEVIAQWFKEHKGELFTMRDLTRKGHKDFKPLPSTQKKKILGELIEAEYVKMVTKVAGNGKEVAYYTYDEGEENE